MGVSSISLTCTLFADNVRSRLSVFVVLSVSLYVCMCVHTVCRFPAVLWWTEQRFGNAHSCWYLRGPDNFITHGLP